MELYIGLVNQDLILNTAEPHRFIALLYLLVLPLTASSLQVKGFQICQWDPGWRTFSSAFGVSSLYRLLLRPFSATSGEESWQSDFTVPHMSTMLMLVRSQRLGSQPWLPLPVTFCMCGWVYLCVCGFFFPSLLHVCVWCRMAGESRTTHFFMLPLLFIPPLLLSFLPIWLQWTALWLSETVIEALRYLIHHGLRNVKRAHYAPPNLTATASGSSYPMNLFGISSVPVRERSVKGKDRMWMTFGSLRLSAGVLYVTSRLQRHHLWKPGEQLCRGRHVFKRRFLFFIKTSVKLQPRLW